jgi:extradiol dioxygenase family protein
MKMPLKPFHLAIAVDDLAASRAFYGGLLGCPEGRSDRHWVDFNFYGHQLVCHLDNSLRARKVAAQNPVDGHDVPVPHFGLVLDMQSWKRIRDRLLAAEVQFIIAPTIRFKGKVGEQATMFFYDPAGNPIEFKAFARSDQLFAK